MFSPYRSLVSKEGVTCCIFSSLFFKHLFLYLLHVFFLFSLLVPHLLLITSHHHCLPFSSLHLHSFASSIHLISLPDFLPTSQVVSQPTPREGRHSLKRKRSPKDRVLFPAGSKEVPKDTSKDISKDIYQTTSFRCINNNWSFFKSSNFFWRVQPSPSLSIINTT